MENMKILGNIAYLRSHMIETTAVNERQYWNEITAYIEALEHIAQKGLGCTFDQLNSITDVRK